MARQQTGGRSRGESNAASGRSGGRSSTGGAANAGGRGGRNAATRGSSGSGSRNDAASQNTQGSDRERQLEVSREGTSAAASSEESSVQGSSQRGLQSRGQQSEALGGRNQAQPSLLPALMANPWLMTNAFLTNPFGFTQALNQEMDRLFSSPLGDVTPAGTQSRRALTSSSGLWNRGMNQWVPQIEVRQRGNELTVCADLPGIKPEDVNIEIDNGVLTISGTREETSENREEGFYRSERSYGSFARSIPLPEGVDENEVQARFENGVLEVTVPVPEQRQRGRKIEIQSGATGGSAERSGSARS